MPGDTADSMPWIEVAGLGRKTMYTVSYVNVRADFVIIYTGLSVKMFCSLIS